MQYALTFIIGAILIILGISHTKGNISSLHSYHIKNIKEEDILPFGKKVGIGNIIIGISIILYSVLMAIFETLKIKMLLAVSIFVLLIGILIGIVIALRAIIKYNHSLF